MSLLDYAERTTEDEDLDDDYDYNDDRPTLDPVEKPTDERGERPNRDYVSPKWGPTKRGRGR